MTRTAAGRHELDVLGSLSCRLSTHQRALGVLPRPGRFSLRPAWVMHIRHELVSEHSRHRSVPIRIRSRPTDTRRRRPSLKPTATPRRPSEAKAGRRSISPEKRRGQAAKNGQSRNRRLPPIGIGKESDRRAPPEMLQRRRNHSRRIRSTRRRCAGPSSGSSPWPVSSRESRPLGNRRHSSPG